MSELALKLIAENKAKHERGEDANRLDLGRLQGLPLTPISSYSPHDDGWGEVFAGMEGAVKRIVEKNKKF